MNMIRSTRTPPEYYERCSDESTLDEAKDLLTAAYENLDVIDFSVNHFEDFQIKLAVAISHIKAANNIKLNNAMNIVKDAQKSLARLEKQVTFADEIIADASRGIEKIERELRNKASMFAEDTPMFDENAEHRTY